MVSQTYFESVDFVVAGYQMHLTMFGDVQVRCTIHVTRDDTIHLRNSALCN